MDLMGEDFWSYGLESNRRTLETFMRYMHEQGLIPESMTIETLSRRARSERSGYDAKRESLKVSIFLPQRPGGTVEYCSRCEARIHRDRVRET